jgi:hypothetical protein
MSEKDSHVFTADNPILQEMGLGTLTTGVINDIVKSQSYKVYFGDNYTQENIIGTQSVDSKIVGAKLFEIKTYRPSNRNYEDFTYNWMCQTYYHYLIQTSNWQYDVNGKDYTWSQSSAGSFLGSFFDDYQDYLETLPSYDKVTYEMVVMNHFVNDITNKDHQDYELCSAIIRDIRNSYQGGIEWDTTVDLYLPGATNPDGTPKLCEGIAVRWKLELFPKVASQPYSPGIVSPIIITDRENAHGVKYQGRDETDRLTTNASLDIANRVAGKLKTHTVELTGEVEAGTTQVMAVMSTDLPAATYPDGGSNSNPDDYKDNTTGFQPTFGKAMPLSMKNGNPYSWGPEWKYKAHCDLTDGEKEEVFEVPVQNKLDQDFAKGQSVILQSIDGTWQPIAGTERAIAPVVITPRVDNWSITSMASNATHYFRTNNFPVRYDEYELGIYNAYYGLDNPYENRISAIRDGYIQISSFDMMGKNVGGNREKHALGNTQIGIRANGQPMEDVTDVFGTTTTPFFGCVFPDGYEAGSKYAAYRQAGPAMIANGPKHPTNDKGLYIRDIPEETIIFSSNVDTYSNTEGSPFQDGSPSLFQLPADIALNASPNTEGIGSPLMITNALWQMFNKDITQIQENCSRYSSDTQRYAWLQDDGGNDTFGFTPKNKNKIQFRPLKAEVYAVFERDFAGTFGLIPNENVEDKNIRGSWSTRCYKKVPDGEPALSKLVYERGPHQYGDAGKGIVGQYGFKHNIDIVDESNGLPSTNSAFPKHFWNIGGSDGWQANQPRPGGAVGIIGAQVTVTAGTAISFSATNYFGMDDYKDQGGIFGGVNNSSYGDKPTDYYSFNNTSLHARIYQHHPKKLTVYDPRFFSVFHFAEGFGDANLAIASLKYMASYKIKGKMTVTEIIADPIQGAAQKWTDLKDSADKAVPIGYHPTGSESGRWIEHVQRYSTSDIRVPTLIGPPLGPVASPTTFDNTTYGSQNASSIDLTGVWNDTGVWRNPEDWRVESKLRGALLPASGNVTTIGIVSKSDGVAYPDQVVIEDGGEGYVQGDVFTVEGGTSKGVSLTANVEYDSQFTGPLPPGAKLGQIDSFTVTGSGGGFLPSDFSDPFGIPAYQSSKKQVKLTSSTDNGKDLKAYIKYGSVIAQSYTIRKPQRATDQTIFDLVNEPPVPHEQHSNFVSAMSISKSVNAIITNPSPTNQYDVFLHYHNDISHVFDEQWGFSPKVKEQFIDLEITPDGSTVTTASSSEVFNTLNNGSAGAGGFNVFEQIYNNAIGFFA